MFDQLRLKPVPFTKNNYNNSLNPQENGNKKYIPFSERLGIFANSRASLKMSVRY